MNERSYCDDGNSFGTVQEQPVLKGSNVSERRQFELASEHQIIREDVLLELVPLREFQRQNRSNLQGDGQYVGRHAK